MHIKSIYPLHEIVCIQIYSEMKTADIRLDRKAHFVFHFNNTRYG